MCEGRKTATSHPCSFWLIAALDSGACSQRKPPSNRRFTHLADRKEESLPVYTDGFRAYEPLDEDDAFDRDYLVHGNGGYADNDHFNTCESVSKDKLTQYLRAFQLRRELYQKPGQDTLKHAIKATL